MVKTGGWFANVYTKTKILTLNTNTKILTFNTNTKTLTVYWCWC